MKAQDPDYATIIQSCLCTNLRLVSRAISKIYDKFLEPTKLKLTQFTVLVAIAYKQSATVSELADLLVMDVTTTSRSLNVLEKQGFIITSYLKENRRTKSVMMTEQGINKIIEILPYWDQAQKYIEDHFGKENVESILFLSQRLVKELKPVL